MRDVRYIPPWGLAGAAGRQRTGPSDYFRLHSACLAYGERHDVRARWLAMALR